MDPLVDCCNHGKMLGPQRSFKVDSQLSVNENLLNFLNINIDVKNHINLVIIINMLTNVWSFVDIAFSPLVF